MIYDSRGKYTNHYIIYAVHEPIILTGRSKGKSYNDVAKVLISLSDRTLKLNFTESMYMINVKEIMQNRAKVLISLSDRTLKFNFTESMYMINVKEIMQN